MYWCAYSTLHSQDMSLGSERNLQGRRQRDKERHLSATPPNDQPPQPWFSVGLDIRRWCKVRRRTSTSETATRSEESRLVLPPRIIIRRRAHMLQTPRNKKHLSAGVCGGAGSTRAALVRSWMEPGFTNTSDRKQVKRRATTPTERTESITKHKHL